MESVDPKTGKPVKSSSGRFLGINTIYGRDGEHGTPYMTRVWFWGLRLHIFHRPDLDEDCHDHPWDFSTFPIWPLHGYVEEVILKEGQRFEYDMTNETFGEWVQAYTKVFQIVPAYRISHRKAEHCHRVLGAWTGEAIHPYDNEVHRTSAYIVNRLERQPIVNQHRKIVTLVWKGAERRKWGFLKNREDKWCWVAWRDYVFAGGKDGPCQ